MQNEDSRICCTSGLGPLPKLVKGKSKKQKARQIEHIKIDRTGTTRGTATVQLITLIKLMLDMQIISPCFFQHKQINLLIQLAQEQHLF